MVSTWMLWLFVLGVAVGAVVTAVALVRLPRRDDDVSAAERPTEAAWIGAVIERNGGVAPALLVEEILELHAAYLRQARPPVPPDTGLGGWPTAAGPPGGMAPGPVPPGYAAPGYVAPGYVAPGVGAPGSAPPAAGAPGSAPPGYPPGSPPPSVALPPGVAPPAQGSAMPPTRR